VWRNGIFGWNMGGKVVLRIFYSFLTAGTREFPLVGQSVSGLKGFLTISLSNH
jgi:hypothetical protein